jgi:hypothetical protein
LGEKGDGKGRMVLTVEFVLNVEQLFSISYRLPVVLSGYAERLMLKREERVILRIEEFFLVV